MPAKSPPWGGGDPRPSCDKVPVPTMSVNPKTVRTTQVPFACQELTKARSSPPNFASAQDHQTGTQSQSAAMPCRPATPPPNTNGLPNPNIQSTGVKQVTSDSVQVGPCGDTLEPVDHVQMNKLELEAAESSTPPSVPPECLTSFEQPGAVSREDTPSLDQVDMGAPTNASTATNSAIKSSPGQNWHAKSDAANNPLQVVGVSLPFFGSQLLDASNKHPQNLGYATTTHNGHISNVRSVTAATQNEQKATPGALVGSVTTKISAIHLTKQGRASVSPECPSASSGQSEGASPECVMQVDGGEEELPDEQENACSDDDCSESSSVCGTSSSASIVNCSSVEEPMSLEVKDEQEKRPALVPSLFAHMPPTLYFSTANEQVEMLPEEQRQLLKWKISTVTPNVVKNTISRSHFTPTKKSHDWMGCWGHHMKSPCFKTLQEHQKLNHFPGTFQIGRKDRLWKNLSKMQVRFGRQEFNFFPRTFVLPQDILLLRKAWKDGSRQKWIIKPPASARGIGIQVIHKWSQMPRKKSLLVQKYLHKPYLISGNKFDLRIYVYVTCYDPLRIYIFSDGLVRFASCKYSSSMKTLSNKFMHLTNYSVNKKNSDYQANSDDKACQGHKWTLKALWQYLGSRGVNTTLIWEKIKDIVIKTIIASEPYVNSLLKMHVRTPYSCHELFGFDVMLDENLKPWILEVNISPSLHSNTALDVAVKGQMVRDLLNLAGFRVPQQDISSGSTSSTNSSLCGGTRETTHPEVSVDEKVKRAFYLKKRFADQAFLATVLDIMTPSDVRVLAESEDELSRCGEFERIFPSPSASRYLRFFECPRYLNMVLDQWERKYWKNRSKGVNQLTTLCQKRVHLGTSDPAHLWSKCSNISKFDHHREEPVNPPRPRVVVIHQHQMDQADTDNGSDEDALVPSPPVSQSSPWSSGSSSACASPQPSL
ncbi:tubulin monoglutamylase TTLL4-like isoform X1 [Nerophis ophidion]|uniref:tubulin monoglutamylase TTLL4-like isoform X1 n=2 Tax=Nerophis ophidion TaxID=159077 RepID=UPI002ADF89FD|nr:tubulin monoglutamylase TTLL4-like isoform X1 [Nerophis ophidion]XP_061735499.1 tubulin monoglutamylase TTLL4-like isoform X1 [Nerophis ophidion]